MNIYLPIAEISVNIFLILGLGVAIGLLSGIFGVGGGFLMTPLLIFIGVPAAVAVGTGANQIVASSVSGVFAHWRRGNVDFKMGGILLAGGLAGSTLGVWLFSLLKDMGQIDLVIRLCYVVFLGIIGSLMMVESIRALARTRRVAKGTASRRKLHEHNWLHGLPFKMRFRKSHLYISAILPIMVGFFVGMLSAIMGVGGGFIMVPAMIYLLGMPTIVVVGTSLFQIIFVMIHATFFQSYLNQTVDVLLAVLLIVSGVIGAQLGTRVGSKMNGEQLRSLLAAMVLLMALKLLLDLVITPTDVYSISLPVSQ